MKRLIVLVLAFSLAAGSLVVPSYAAQTTPYGISDLLLGVEYDRYMNGIYQATHSAPTLWFSGATSCEWRWSVADNTKYNHVIVSLNMVKKPDSVKLWYSGAYQEMTFLYQQGNNYYYRISKAVSLDQGLRIQANFSSTYYGTFGIDALYGYVSNSIAVSSVEWFSNVWVGYADSGEKWPVTVYSGTDSLPVGISYDEEIPNYSEGMELFYGEVFWKVTSPVDYLDSLTYMVLAVDEISHIGARLEDSSGNIIADLPVDYIYSGETQVVADLGEYMFRAHAYSISIDLNGYSLAGRKIVLTYRVDRIACAPTYGSEYGYFTQVIAAAFTPLKSEVSFWNSFVSWLRGQYFQIRSMISSVGTNIVNKLDELFGSSGDADQFQDDVNNQGDKLDDMQGVLDSVTQPALDSIDTDISGIVSDADLSNVAHVYTFIIDDNILSPALSMVAILAMMSYALFGKR